MHHALQNRGRAHLAALQVPAPQFSRRALVIDRSAAGGASRSAEPPPASSDPPVPANPPVRPEGVEQLRWAHCPDDDRLHLVQLADATLVAAGGHTQAVCGRRILAEDLTINSAASGVLCMVCVITATA